MSKLTLLAAFGAGYVLGARAGRERYEQIASSARKVAGNPTVQAASQKAQDTISQQGPVVAEAVKDKAASAASTVQDKVSDKLHHGNGQTSTTPTSSSKATGPRN